MSFNYRIYILIVFIAIFSVYNFYLKSQNENLDIEYIANEELIFDFKSININYKNVRNIRLPYTILDLELAMRNFMNADEYNAYIHFLNISVLLMEINSRNSVPINELRNLSSNIAFRNTFRSYLDEYQEIFYALESYILNNRINIDDYYFMKGLMFIKRHPINSNFYRELETKIKNDLINLYQLSESEYSDEEFMNKIYHEFINNKRLIDLIENFN